MALFYVIVSAVLAGLNLPALKFGLTELSPPLLMFIRFAVATLVLFVISKPKLQRAAILPSVFSGAALLFIILGLNLTTISYTQAIMVFIPIAVGLGAHFLLGEKQTLKTAAGLLFGLAGTLLIIFEVKLSGTNGHELVFGNILVFLSAILSALYIVECRKLSKVYASIDVTFAQFLVTTVIFGLITLVSKALGMQLVYEQISMVSVYSLVYLIIFGTLLMFVFYQKGIKQTNAYTVGLSQYIQLPVSVLSGVIFFGDKTSAIFLIGTALILVGSAVGTLDHFGGGGGD